MNGFRGLVTVVTTSGHTLAVTTFSIGREVELGGDRETLSYPYSVGLLPVGDIARNALGSDPVSRLIIDGHMDALTQNDPAILANPAVSHIAAIRILEGRLQPGFILRMNDLQNQLGIGIELLGCITENVPDHWVDVLTAQGIAPVAVDQIFGVFDELPKVDLCLYFLLDRLSPDLALAQLFLDQFDGYPVNGFLDIPLRQYVSSPDFSDGIPEEGSVRGTLLTHHSMKFAAHSFPAPRRPLLEAKQTLGECFLS
jgi:hypothetical protein